MDYSKGSGLKIDLEYLEKWVIEIFELTSCQTVLRNWGFKPLYPTVSL